MDKPLTEPAILRMERTEEEKKRRSIEGDIGAKFSESKQYEPRPDQISNSLTSVQKDNLLIEPFNDDEGCSRTIKAQPDSRLRRGRVQDGGEVTPTICSAQQGLCPYEGVEPTPQIVSYSRDSKGHVTNYHLKDSANTIQPSSESFSNTAQYLMEKNYYRIRKLTPRECFRLMDVDDADIDRIQAAGISNSQQYKLAGNSIVVSCLYHIFLKMFVDTSSSQPTQLTLF